MTVKENLERVMRDLETERDELALKMHLAKADARDEWEKLETRWKHFKAKATVVGHEAADVADDVGVAARDVLDELKKGYDRLRNLVV
jgi:hypothetical protein